MKDFRLDEIAELRAENLQLIQDATNLDNYIDPNNPDNALFFNGGGRNNTVEEVSNDSRIS